MKGTALLIIARLYDLIVIAALLVISISLITSGGNGMPRELQVVSFACMLIAIFCMAGLSRMMRVLARATRHLQGFGLARRWVNASTRLTLLLNDVATAIDAMPVFDRLVRLPTITLGVWGTLYVMFYAVMRYLDVDVAFFSSFAASSGAVVTMVLPINGIGSFGTLEAGWVIGYTLIGISTDTALVTGLVMHLLVVYFSCVLAGLGALCLCRYRTKTDTGTGGQARRNVFDADPKYYPSQDHHKAEIEQFFGRRELVTVPDDDAPGGPSVSSCYVICFTNRCGSNLLGTALKQTGKLGNPGEYLNSDAVLRVSKANGISSYPDYIRYLARQHQSPNGVLGLKAAARQLFHLTETGIIPNVLRPPRYVFIRRRDLVAQAVSLYIGQQNKAWTSEIPALQVDIQYDEARIMQLLHGMAISNGFFEYYFSLHSVRPVRVWYEDLVADLAGELERIASALGVHIDKMPSISDLPLKRQIDARKDEFTRRIREKFRITATAATDAAPGPDHNEEHHVS